MINNINMRLTNPFIKINIDVYYIHLPFKKTTCGIIYLNNESLPPYGGYANDYTRKNIKT